MTSPPNWSRSIVLIACALLFSKAAWAGEELRVSVDQSAYQPGQNIRIQISNVGSELIHYSSGPRCGSHLEINQGGTWRIQAVCFSCYNELGSAPCQSKTLAPKESFEEVFPIEIGSKTQKAPAGIYRAAFPHMGKMAYSETFTIGSPTASPKPSIEGVVSPPALPTDSWPEYDELTAQIAELSKELNEKNSEIVRQYGRNDTPEGLAILNPIREALRAANEKQKLLLACEKKPKGDYLAVFESIGVPTLPPMNRPDDELLRGYVESRVMDGTITAQQKVRMWRIASLRSRGVMNPASRGAHQIIAATVEALACFGIDTPPSPSAQPKAGLVSSEPVALARKYAADHHITLYHYHQKQIGNSDGFFAPIVMNQKHEIFLTGTGSKIPPGGKYSIGKSFPVVIKLSPSGKLLWKAVLTKKGFLDYEGGSLAPTPDGGCVAFILSYVHPARGASTRLVRLKSSGDKAWDYHFRGQGRLNTPFADSLQLLASGATSIQGHIYLTKGSLTRWSAEVDSTGKVTSEQPGP